LRIYLKVLFIILAAILLEVWIFNFHNKWVQQQDIKDFRKEVVSVLKPKSRYVNEEYKKVNGKMYVRKTSMTRWKEIERGKK
jgi:hypothetical protein